MLETVDAVIEALGGPAKAAELCGVGTSAVSNWRSRKRIPAEKFMRVTGALDGREVDPAVFGIEPASVAEART